MDQAIEENIAGSYLASRSDSVGSYDAGRELQEPSSVDLLRNSIFRSIANKQTPTKLVDIQERHGYRSRHKVDFPNLTKADIDVKFLKKRCSSIDSTLPSTNDIDRERLKRRTSVPVPETLGKKNGFSDLNKPVKSNSSKTSQKLSSEKATLGKAETETIDENKELKNSNNSLRLAFRNSNHGIFEDCSTYNITCRHEVNLVEEKEDEQCKQDDPSTVGSAETQTAHIESSFELLQSDTEDTFSTKSVRSVDDENSLCDTFFSHVINGESSGPQLSDPSTVDRKQSLTSIDLKNDNVPASDGDNVSTFSTNSENRRRNSRRVRKRNRKSQSREPCVYDCPKCGASYVLSTNGDVACCLHCDLWTSVEPVFMKREKLSWSTCRIC